MGSCQCSGRSKYRTTARVLYVLVVFKFSWMRFDSDLMSTINSIILSSIVPSSKLNLTSLERLFEFVVREMIIADDLFVH